jgi:hypothetical protein
MALFAPPDWPSVVINIVALAAGFGSGTVRLFHSSTPANYVDIEVAASYVGPLEFAVAPTWTPSASLGGFQFHQFALTREADNVVDDLAEDFSILAVVLTEGP